MTLERFEKLAKMNQGLFASAVLDKCEMTCGDFIDLVCAWERSTKEGLEGRQNSDLNLKKAGSFASDMYRTPTASAS